MTDRTYRKAVEQIWRKGRIVPEEVVVLGTLEQQLGISEEIAEGIERSVMGMTKEEALVAGMGADLRTAPAAPGPVPAAPAPEGLDTLSGGSTLVGEPGVADAPQAPSGSSGPASPPAGMEPGTVIRDRYEVLSTLGRGGMGQVLKVHDLRMGEVRALKVLAPEHAGRPDLLERMKREVRLCQMLRHPGIVQVFDYDEDDAAGLVFFTMEYIEGQTLRQWLLARKGEAVPLEQVERISQGIGEALEYAHGQNVVHLDLKPDNVILTEDLSQVRILDFGISRAVGVQGLQTMLSGAGTPYYMAPEHEQGSQDVGSPADVYAFGAIVYELLTGMPPRGNFLAPHFMRGEVPEGWGHAVMAALSPQPVSRPGAAGLLARGGPGSAASTEQDASDFQLVRGNGAGLAQEHLPRPGGGPGVSGASLMTILRGVYEKIRVDVGGGARGTGHGSWDKAVHKVYVDGPPSEYAHIEWATIPAKKLRNARRVCRVPGGEVVHLLIDSTLFGSAHECFLVGDTGVYAKNFLSARDYLDWGSFAGAVVVKGDEEFGPLEIRADGALLFTFACGTAIDVEAAYQVLLALQSWARGEGALG